MMKTRTVFSALALLIFMAMPLHAAPALISEPDYNDSFTIVAEPRRNPDALGVVTRDGYPVFSDPHGGIAYIEQRGERIPGPLAIPGAPVLQVVTGPVGHEVPTVETRGGHIGLTEE